MHLSIILPAVKFSCRCRSKFHVVHNLTTSFTSCVRVIWLTTVSRIKALHLMSPPSSSSSWRPKIEFLPRGRATVACGCIFSKHALVFSWPRLPLSAADVSIQIRMFQINLKALASQSNTKPPIVHARREIQYYTNFFVSFQQFSIVLVFRGVAARSFSVTLREDWGGNV